MWPSKFNYLNFETISLIMLSLASLYYNFPNYFVLQNKKSSRLSKRQFYSKVSCKTIKEDIFKTFLPIETYKNILNANSSIEAVISELQSFRDNSSFFLFCKDNRHYINYSLLYRLTSLKLRAESDKKIQNQSLVVDNFRNKILERLLIIDQPVSQGFILAEKRLKDLISNETFTYETIIESFGKKSIEVSCFWIVLNAALAAWENKKNNENNLTNSEIYSKMKIINNILYQSKFHQYLMPVEIKHLDIKLNKREIKIKDDNLYIDYIEGLMLIMCHLEKKPSSSYSFFLHKTKNILQEIFLENFGEEIENFEYTDVKFNPSQIAPLSKLIQVKLLK